MTSFSCIVHTILFLAFFIQNWLLDYYKMIYKSEVFAGFKG